MTARKIFTHHVGLRGDFQITKMGSYCAVSYPFSGVWGKPYKKAFFAAMSNAFQ
jgi:hypothetical protein